jgi:hypothetical protein
LVTIDEYNQWFHDAGFEPTGEGTLLTEEWVNEHDTYIIITRGSELGPADRAAAVERYKEYLGIGRPIGGGGVH